MESVASVGDLPRSNISCFVYGCFSTAANRPNLGFHKFPGRGRRNIVVVKKNGDKCIYDRRQVWIDVLSIGREAALALDGITVYVCSLHFARDDFYYNQDITGRRYLKELAIPRRNLPVQKTSPLTTKFNVRTLNRLKYRGHFNIHNPDGRKLTAPRRFLGAGKLKDTAGNQSYTRTVWVVRKPKDQRLQENSTNDDSELVGGLSVSETFSLAEQDDTELEDSEQCTVLDNGERGPLFTSELIIKDEPLSDTEQECAEIQFQKSREDDLAVTQESTHEYEEDDMNYESNKLVIQTEDEEEEIRESEMLEPTDIEEQVEYNETEEEVEYGEREDLVEYSEMEEEADPGGSEENEGYNFYENEQTNGLNEEDELPLEVSFDENVEEGNNEENENEGNSNFESYKMYDENDEENEEEETYNGKDDYFVCLVCSEIFPSQQLLAMHSITHQDMTEEEHMLFEEKTKSLTCEFCGRVLSTKSTLREHIMIHTGEKPNECMLCGKSFRHKANLVVHINSHAVVSTYKCKKCNKAFTKKMDFEAHLKVHVDSSGNLLVCKICNAVFKSQRTLYNHSQLHNRKGTVRKRKRNTEPQNSTYKCRTCGKILSTKATLREHEMIHSGEKPHTCNICGRTIRHKANFVVHVQTHGQGKSYECDMCDEAFMRKSDLTQHKQLQHSKSKLLRCPICSEVFKSPNKFNRHMEIHESVVYMNETESLAYQEDDGQTDEFQPHMLECVLEA